MKKVFRIFIAALVALTCLACYDDSSIRETLSDHEERIQALESLCSGINSNIEALQTLVAALEDADYVTSITPVFEDKVEVGYTITFAKYGSVTIFNGKDGVDGTDGKDGASPVVGVKRAEDGSYYWTLDGEYILDDKGQKISVTGVDGEDGKDGENGAVPQLKVDDDYWYASYDGGLTWKEIGEASDTSADCLFRKVYTKDGYVCFEMTNGTTYKVPMTASSTSSSGLDIIFGVEQGAPVVPGGFNIINYRVVGGDDKTLVRAICDQEGNIEVYVDTETQTTGRLVIEVYDEFESHWNPERDDSDVDGFTNEEQYLSSFTVLVCVSDGKGNSVFKMLNLTEGVLESVKDTYMLGPEGGRFTVQVKGNMQYKVRIDEDITWLRHIPQTRADIRTDELVFECDAADPSVYRRAWVDLVGDNGSIYESLCVYQKHEDYCYDCEHYPCECYVQRINIDGDFSDWNDIDQYLLTVAKCDPEAKYTALSTLKAYADEYYIFLYVEYDEEQIIDRSWVPFHVFINVDYGNATGGFVDYWTGSFIDCMLETAIVADDAYANYDPSFFKWWGEVGGTGWCWTDPSVEHSGSDNWGAIIGEGSGVASSAGRGNAFEIAILKEMLIGFEFAGTYTIGVEIEQSWNAVGVLPNTACTDDNPNGKAPMLMLGEIIK